MASSITLSLPRRNPSRHILIYFIPGNPGLIEFYRPFLNHLHTTLEPLSNKSGTAFTIHGASLANFHTGSTTHRLADGSNPSSPLNLQDMISHTELSLALTARSGPDAAPQKEPTDVILIGHSVGAYIMMSILSRRHHHHAQQRSTNPSHNTTSNLNILAGIGLFPTVIDLYRSPSGRKVSWIAHVPGFSLLLQAVAKLLTFSLPSALLIKLVQAVTGQPEPAAQVTASFLCSPRGVRQAIYLAQHELLEMREDRWEDEVWGLGTSASEDTSSSLQRQYGIFFYFGARDHWIADSTRDRMIATRHRRRLSEGEPGPRMEIDDNGLPHDFCVREDHSKVAAEKVVGYIGSVLAGKEQVGKGG